MGLGLYNTCPTYDEIISDGGLVRENQDGTVSVYLLNAQNQLAPAILKEQCCLRLNPNYTYDIDNQECRWTNSEICSSNNPFNIVLNPQGNDSTIFYVEENQNCVLNVRFDYLFKIDCSTLFDLQSGELTQIFEQVNQTTPTAEINQLELQIQEQSVLCQEIQNQIDIVRSEISTTPYSIICQSGNRPINNETNIPSQYEKVFSRTAFDNVNQSIVGGTLPPAQPRTDPPPSVTFCLTEPDGLNAWLNILGPVNYQNFLNNVSNSYNCAQVQQLVDLNETNLNNDPNSAPLLYQCDVAGGTRTELEFVLSQLLQQLSDCNDIIIELNNQLEQAIISGSTTIFSTCSRAIDMFESLDASFVLNVITSANTINPIYVDNNLFPQIGVGNLYNYLINRANSGFYVCGGNDCTPFFINPTIDQTNDLTCDNILTNLVQDLYAESNLSGVTGGFQTFLNSIPTSAFTSGWLSYEVNITDPQIIEAITNNKINIGIRINETCGNFCILLDNIRLEKNCVENTLNKIFVTQSPGFELERIIDNKKSWKNNQTTENREFIIYDVSGTDSIRDTSYTVDDERLVINTKEIDLNMNLASGIEVDLATFVLNNPCILTGLTTCDPCYSGESGIQICCGDNTISFNSLLSKTTSEVSFVETMKDILLSELIDAKNRQTISAYPTLRALYDRYINSTAYCQTQSSGFDYMSMERFSNLIDGYWVDLVEQVVPATTIWGSVKIYTNTAFDRQKFKYRSYSSLFCNNPFEGDRVLSPINGTSGQCENVSVSMAPIYPVIVGQEIERPKPITSKCNFICLAQMNHGSEFIGTVNVIGQDPVTYESESTDIIISE